MVLALGFIFSFISSAQAGLVAYYPFTGNANDESGNGNDGIVSGSVLVEDRFGNADSAYYFDGDDRITASNPFAPGYMRSDSFTVTAWIKTNTPLAEMIVGQYVYGDGLTDDDHFGLYLGPNGDFQAGCFVLGFNSQDMLLADDQWHYVAMVLDEAGDSLSLYVIDMNGQIKYESVSGIDDALDAVFNPDIPITIGNLLPSDLGGHGWIGSLDEVRIYDHALSLNEIQELSQVPIPGAIFLLGSGLMGLVGLRRKIKSLIDTV